MTASAVRINANPNPESAVDAREGSGAGPAPGAQHMRESAATLSALAQQSASFSPAAAGGSGAAPTQADPLADLNRSAFLPPYLFTTRVGHHGGRGAFQPRQQVLLWLT